MSDQIVASSHSLAVSRSESRARRIDACSLQAQHDAPKFAVPRATARCSYLHKSTFSTLPARQFPASYGYTYSR